MVTFILFLHSIIYFLKSKIIIGFALMVVVFVSSWLSSSLVIIHRLRPLRTVGPVSLPITMKVSKTRKIYDAKKMKKKLSVTCFVIEQNRGARSVSNGDWIRR